MSEAPSQKVEEDSPESGLEAVVVDVGVGDVAGTTPKPPLPGDIRLVDIRSCSRPALPVPPEEATAVPAVVLPLPGEEEDEDGRMGPERLCTRTWPLGTGRFCNVKPLLYLKLHSISVHTYCNCRYR